MPKYRVSTTVSGRTDDQDFTTKQEALDAAAELSRSGFFSTVYERVAFAGEPYDYLRYLCEYAPDPEAEVQP